MNSFTEKLLQNVSTFSWEMALFVFVIYIVIDALYAIYIRRTAEKNALSSANYGAILHIFLAIGVISYVNNFLYIIPLVLGSWVGTYLAVKYSKV